LRVSQYFTVAPNIIPLLKLGEMRFLIGKIYKNKVSGVHLNFPSKLAIVNAPLVSLHSKNTNNAKSEVRYKQMIRNPWCVHNREVTCVQKMYGPVAWCLRERKRDDLRLEKREKTTACFNYLNTRCKSFPDLSGRFSLFLHLGSLN
jgi:hypothetical protein